jgi:UPF0716 protein FxsA
MRFRFLIPLLALAEIAVLILVGQAIGVLATLALVVLGTISGVAFLRHHGVTTLARMRADIAARKMPARPLVEGAIGTAAALLLILPGFLSDALGIALLIPAVRSAIWRRLASRMTIVAGRGRPAPARGAVVELGADDYRPVAANPESTWRGGGPES